MFSSNISDYSIGAFLGKGTFGKVYKTTFKNASFAIKIMDIDKLEQHQAFEKVVSECKIHASLDHPNIISLKHYFEDDKAVYMIMEVAVKSLSEYIKAAKRCTEYKSRIFMTMIIDALRYLHRRKIIHRDISTNNILLDQNENIKIADFGLATLQENVNTNFNQNTNFTMCGTPNFIAPEVVNRNGHGAKADVWGLGCVFYTLLAGKPPFDTKTTKETILKIKALDFKLPLGLSVEAGNLIRRLIQTDHNNRPSLEDIHRDPFLQPKITSRLPTSYLSGSSTSNSTGNNYYAQNSLDSGINSFNSHNPVRKYFTNNELDNIKEESYQNKKLHSLDDSILNTSSNGLSENKENYPNQIMKRGHSSSNLHTRQISDPMQTNSPELFRPKRRDGYNLAYRISKSNMNTPVKKEFSARNRFLSTSVQNKITGPNLNCKPSMNYLSNSCKIVNKIDTDCRMMIPKLTNVRQKLENNLVKSTNNLTVSLESDVKISKNHIPALNLASSISNTHFNEPNDELTRPLSTKRLRPEQNRGTISRSTILANGEGCVLELLKHSVVYQVIYVSCDGMTVTIGVPVRKIGLNDKKPCPIDQLQKMQKYAFDSLPPKFYKKYKNLRRLCDIIRSKTPKLTLYSNEAKCVLMENIKSNNSSNFECEFYHPKSKILLKNESTKTKVVYKDGNLNFDLNLGSLEDLTEDGIKSLTNQNGNSYLSQIKQIKHCWFARKYAQSLEKELSEKEAKINVLEPSQCDNKSSFLNNYGFEKNKFQLFPVIFGVRPVKIENLSGSETSSTAPNSARNTSSSKSNSLMVSTGVCNNDTNNFQSINSIHASQIDSWKISPPQRRDGSLIISKMDKKVNNKFIPNKGWLTDYGNGLYSCQFNDGIKTEYDVYKKISSFTDQNGNTKNFGANFNYGMPEYISEKIREMQEMIGEI